MATTLTLPFQLQRPDAATPATTANDIDISAIEGLDASTVQAALELIFAYAKSGAGSSTNPDYTHKCLTETQMSALSADDAEEGVIYMSLEGWDGTTVDTSNSYFGNYFGFVFGGSSEDEETSYFGTYFGFTFNS